MPKCKDNILVTICARGGSKGLPNKNIKPLLGKPLINWTIEQAKEWREQSDCKIAICSDSQKIYNVVSDYLDDTTFFIPRPPSLAKDDTPKMDAIRYADT